MLRVGFGRIDITPAPGLRLAGNAPYPRAERIGDQLHANRFREFAVPARGEDRGPPVRSYPPGRR